MIRFGELSRTSVHLCVDMQRLFVESTEWATPWGERVMPKILALTQHRPEQTIFTRFIPAAAPGQGRGTWKRYYERWASMTLEHLGEEMLQLAMPLALFVPPASVVDKHVYAPWMETDLHLQLRRSGVDTLIVTGGETEVCVLATVLGAIDLGYRVVLATDALCSSADSTHDAMIEIYAGRYAMQVETSTVEEILTAWR